MAKIPAGWYPDPLDADQIRYWDGETWTFEVADQAAINRDPDEDQDG